VLAVVGVVVVAQGLLILASPQAAFPALKQGPVKV
jgi:hypothetical protein